MIRTVRLAHALRPRQAGRCRLQARTVVEDKGVAHGHDGPHERTRHDGKRELRGGRGGQRVAGGRGSSAWVACGRRRRRRRMRAAGKQQASGRRASRWAGGLAGGAHAAQLRALRLEEQVVEGDCVGGVAVLQHPACVWGRRGGEQARGWVQGEGQGAHGRAGTPAPLDRLRHRSREVARGVPCSRALPPRCPGRPHM